MELDEIDYEIFLFITRNSQKIVILPLRFLSIYNSYSDFLCFGYRIGDKGIAHKKILSRNTNIA